VEGNNAEALMDLLPSGDVATRQDVDRVESRLDAFEQRVDDRFKRVDDHFVAFEQRMDDRFERVDERFAAFAKSQSELEKRLVARIDHSRDQMIIVFQDHLYDAVKGQTRTMLFTLMGTALAFATVVLAAVRFT
jgi:hypothetical protein